MHIYSLLQDYRLIVEGRFARPNDPESYAPVRATHASQVKGYPAHPGWRLTNSRRVVAPVKKRAYIYIYIYIYIYRTDKCFK
jgi:hypothetical protein